MLNVKKSNGMDEMQKDIQLKSIKCGSIFTTLALSAWIIIGILKGIDWRLPVYILCAQNLVCFVSKQLYRKQVEDEGWKKDLTTLIIDTLLLLFITLLIAYLFIGKS